MLALLKSGRSCVAAPVARAAAVRASAAGAASCRLLSGGGGGGPVVRSLVSLHRRLVSALVQQSRALLRLAVVQCEFVLIYRTRRSLQLFELYSSLYEREALHEMVRSVRRLLAAHGRRLLLSAAIVSATDAPHREQEQQPTEHAEKQQQQQQKTPPERHGYEEEFDRFARLREQSIVCPECRLRQLIDTKVHGVEYCACAGGQPTTAANRGDDTTWVPFIERNHVVVWRQQHREAPHLYSYKVYGSYDDVSADSFLEVQLNTEYRTAWDPSVLELHPLERRPGQRGDLLYWQVKFPTMFQNRDYVFERRYYVDRAARQMTVVSRCSRHPDCPERPGVVRVRRYWSVMVIRPHTHFNRPGLDFGLTYFDDPGTYLPPVITNYVAYTGLPNFLERVAEAARAIQRQLSSGQVTVPLCYLQPPPGERPQTPPEMAAPCPPSAAGGGGSGRGAAAPDQKQGANCEYGYMSRSDYVAA